MNNLDKTNENWPGSGRTLIAGPCSAESREQVLQTARGLKATGCVTALRAGIWKPRTRAGGFEGHGAPALDWLRDAREETGLGVMTEVATAEHVEACLEAEIDSVWIGARTTANPFSVQEIANALKGTGMKVLVKNPINPDVELWIGAVERLWNAGIEDIGAIHRGFATGKASPYRNSPEWGLAQEFSKRMPMVPVVCDPSHMAGKRNAVKEIAQMGLNQGACGLMVEVHTDPDSAWTDAKQQLSPCEYKQMVGSLSWAPQKDDALESLRHEIDRLDQQLLELVASRMEISKQIGVVKRDKGLEAHQPKRWSALMESRVAQAERLGMSTALVQTLFDHMHEESIRVQRLA